MQPSILRRGLAVSAVSALAVTGLTMAPAHAVGPDVAFISIYNPTHRVSTRLDADTSHSITLVAAADNSDSPTVSFEYNTDPAAGPATAGWTGIGVSPTYANGIARAEWSPSNLNGRSISVRLVAETVDGISYAIRNNVAVSGDSSAVNAVHLDSLTGGYFVQPYADSSRTKTLKPVSGTTSATGGSVELSWWRASDDTFQGQTDAAVSPLDLKSSGFPSTESVAGGEFNGALDISAYGADPGDLLLVGARRDTDDVSPPVTLYAQTLTAASATMDSPTSTGTPVEIRATDQSMNPIAGAEVRRQSDGSLVGYTDGEGIAIAKQPNSSSETYYVNATDNNAYEGGTDQATSMVTTGAFTPTASDTEVRLADGDVFDDDEYAAGDVALQVVDQNGDPFTGVDQVSYTLYPTGTTPPAPTTASTDANGRLVVPFAPSGPDGEYTLEFTGPASTAFPAEHSQTFVAGQAALSLSPGSGVAASGGEITFKGSLAVDGSPLPGRAVAITYKRGVELVPGSGADAGMTGVGGALSATVTTGAKGTFTVTVDDPAEAGNPTETGGKLSAATANNVASGESTVTGNAQESTSSTAEFGSGKGGVKVTLKGASKAGGPDKLAVVTPKSVQGEQVTVLRKVGKGKWTAVVTKRLGAAGLKLALKDPNGAKVVLYKATIVTSDRVKSTTSKILKLK
ncbi:hypothetical protein GCM10009795_009370 [Nocardioides hankookensis]|uniref:Big-1 domain-containing protein n=1 Tax=Nocardioides hankookensis TaxID=443157 RepID=A0ABW1LGJ9_9ACTN